MGGGGSKPAASASASASASAPAPSSGSGLAPPTSSNPLSPGGAGGISPPRGAHFPSYGKLGLTDEMQGGIMPGANPAIHAGLSSRNINAVANTGPSMKWKEDSSEKMKKYNLDGSLPFDDYDPGHLELRTLLDEPIGQRFIGEHAKKKFTEESFYAWTEIQEYKHIPTADYRRCTAMHIYAKYIKTGSVCEIGSIEAEKKLYWDKLIDELRVNKHVATSDLLDDVQYICFKEMFLNTFMDFRKTQQYVDLMKVMNEDYNKVTVDDFDYIKKLGVGGFGRVVEVRKKSTGKHYALKTQLKKALVDAFSDNPSRLDSEKVVFAVCHHPFIIDMDYAFQTEGHAILVLGLATAGDLQEAINRSPENRLDERRVAFYSAEIALALAHLHDLRLMYRDLKPCNVLLNEDGNIKLADMGGVADFGGSVFAKEEGGSQQRGKQQVKEDFRRKSIMGTHGYMAPEMVRMMGQASSQRSGYTSAVDYWSLGVTVYKLLTGTRPFDNAMYAEAENDEANRSGVQGSSEYRALHRPVEYPSYFSDEAKSFIQRLLDTNEKTRIGCDERGIEGIKEHPFFRDLDWILMQQCHLEAPFVPGAPDRSSKPAYKSYDDMMKQIDKDEREEEGIEEVDWGQLPNEDEQKFFKNWDFVSPRTLKVEMGIANAIAGCNQQFKVRQLLGSINQLPSEAQSGKKGTFRIFGSLGGGKDD